MKGRLFRSAALALAVVGAGGAFAASAQAKPKLVASGALDWGVYASWRGYVKGGEPGTQGTITTTGRARENADGTFKFPVRQGSADDESGALRIDLAGGVKFEKPVHGVDIRFSALQMRIDPESPDNNAIYARVVAREFKGMGEPAGDLIDYGVLPLVALDPSGVTPVVSADTIGWSDVPTELTAEATPIFGGYPTSTAFDPATIAGDFAGPLRPRVKPRSTARLKGRRAVVAQVRCGLGPCSLKAPKRAELRIGRKTLSAQVKVPQRLGPGATRPVKVVLERRAAQKLAGRTGTVKLELSVIGAEERTASAKVRVKLTGGKR